MLVLGAIGFGTWWFALRDTSTPTSDGGGGGGGEGGGNETITPPAATCWDGTTTDPCPTFEKTAAAVYVFGPVDDTNDAQCTPYGSGYLPSGSTYVTSCYISSEHASATISQWPSTDAAASAFKNFGSGYKDNGKWTKKNSSDEMGTQWVLDTSGGTATSTISADGYYFAVNCYDDIPFCIEFSGSPDDINTMQGQFHALSLQEVQDLADYLDSH